MPSSQADIHMDVSAASLYAFIKYIYKYVCVELTLLIFSPRSLWGRVVICVLRACRRRKVDYGPRMIIVIHFGDLIRRNFTEKSLKAAIDIVRACFVCFVYSTVKCAVGQHSLSSDSIYHFTRTCYVRGTRTLKNIKIKCASDLCLDRA